MMIPFQAVMVQNPIEADIYTLGYADWTPVELEIALDRLDAVLVDIRFAPWSKDPVWRIDALRVRFGWRYVHLPALGNRNFRTGGPVELADPRRGVAQVEAMTQGPFHPLLLCACRDARRCHRSQAAALLRARGHRVQEISALDPQTRLWPS